MLERRWLYTTYVLRCLKILMEHKWKNRDNFVGVDIKMWKYHKSTNLLKFDQILHDLWCKIPCGTAACRPSFCCLGVLKSTTYHKMQNKCRQYKEPTALIGSVIILPFLGSRCFDLIYSFTWHASLPSRELYSEISRVEIISNLRSQCGPPLAPIL